MSCIQKVSCELTDNREVYRAGEAVSGQWVVSAGEAFRVTDIWIKLVGMVYVKWSEGLTVRSNTSRDIITNQRIDVLEHVHYTKEGQNYIIPVGMHYFKFNFKLPEHALPSSYEGVCGAVRYLLKLAIKRSSILYAEKDRYKPITVLDYIDVNATAFSNIVEQRTEVKVPRALGLGYQGSVYLHAETDRSAYCPGEEILISVNASNKSEKDFGIIEASLIQKALFSSSSTTRIAKKQLVLKTVQGSPLLKKTSETWTKFPIKIDPVPPSTRDDSCFSITVSYLVQVAVKVASVLPFAEFGDIVVRLPITIGTTPRGLKSSAVEATEATIDVDLPETCDFIYRQCEKGFEYFTDDGEDFPAIKYKPFCAYMQDLRLNANGFKDGEASTSATKSSIVVQALQSNDNKWPTNTGRTREVPSAPPCESSVLRKEYSTNSQVDSKESSAPAPPFDPLPTYDEAIAQDKA